MRTRRPAPLTAGLLLLAACVAMGADRIDERERGLAVAVASRRSLVEERTVLARQAEPLADAITRLKGETRGVRADRVLEERLRAFDRVARELDDLERRIAEADRTIARHLGALESEIDDALASLSAAGSGPAIAERVKRLETIRRDARALARSAPERRFRPLLDVALESDDGPAEIREKLKLLSAEGERLEDENRRLDRAGDLLEARTALKRQLALELDAARREGGSSMNLVQREIDNVSRDLRDLETASRELAEERRKVEDARTRLSERTTELERRLRALSTPVPRVEAP